MPRTRRRAEPGQERLRSALAPEQVRARFGADLPLDALVASGIISTSGAASADAHRKLKQIHHFVRLIRPALDDVLVRASEPVLVDFGAGRAGLALTLHVLVAQPHPRARTIAVEARPDLCARTRAAAGTLDLERFDVAEARIADAPLPDRLHFALALHACDTATDDAIAAAVRRGADHIALVPCCQAEVARQLAEVRAAQADRGLSTLWSGAWHRREFGAHLTNVIRVLALRAHGYQVTVTELAGWEHTPKNELILARRVGRFHRDAMAELDALLAQIPVRPALLDSLGPPDAGA